MAHKWAGWLHNPCRRGGPHRFRAGEIIKNGPRMGRVATLALPPGGSPTLQSAENIEKWSTNVPGGYIATAGWGVPNATERGKQSEVAQKGAGWLHHPCHLGGVPKASEGGKQSEIAHKWAEWLHNPCRLGGSQRFRAGQTIRIGKNQKRHKKRLGGYIPPTTWGFPNTSERGKQSEVAHKWAGW